jgi:RNA-directed DNA polymerase
LNTSVGVDKQNVKSAKESFDSWSKVMLQSMHNKGYKPPPTRRVYIPKPGKTAMRPIAVPTVQDRCLQKSVSDVLNSIYEQDFLPCSYGGRPKRSAHQAIANLNVAISARKVSWVFEADLKNFFGSLNQDWVEQFLKHRVGDLRITNLIRRWLKAGVMEEGKHLESNTGTAQGGPISVLISNIYLHYVLDLWIEKAVKPKMLGEVYYIRYLDDFVLCFQHRSDAMRFKQVLPKRLEKFSLELEPSKTKLLEFGRFAKQNASSRGKKVDTFNFLGFTFYCDRNRRGGFKVGMKTEKSRLSRSYAKMKLVLQRIRHRPIREQSKLINIMLNGHYRYYGVGGNWRCIDHFLNFTLRYWRKALSSRSQNGKVNWKKFHNILKIFPLSQPKLYLSFKAISKMATL